MGLRDAANKDKMDKTIYQSDYFTGYGVKDWDVILSGLFHTELGRPGQVMDGPTDRHVRDGILVSCPKLRTFGDMTCSILF